MLWTPKSTKNKNETKIIYKNVDISFIYVGI
jgi:hypothetical protein